MKLNFLKSCFLLTVVATAMALSSCKKLLDVQPESGLSGNQTYRNVYDADAAVLGVYAKFMQLAQPYVLLNELRADLMSQRGASLKEIADAAAPLYQSLDDAQKRRFSVLARLDSRRSGERHHWRHRRHGDEHEMMHHGGGSDTQQPKPQ